MAYAVGVIVAVGERVNVAARLGDGVALAVRVGCGGRGVSAGGSAPGDGRGVLVGGSASGDGRAVFVATGDGNCMATIVGVGDGGTEAEPAVRISNMIAANGSTKSSMVSQEARARCMALSIIPQMT